MNLAVQLPAVIEPVDLSRKLADEHRARRARWAAIPRPIDMKALYREAVAYNVSFDLVRKQAEQDRRRLTVLQIQRVVGAQYGSTIAELIGPRRSQHIVRPRMIAVYIASKLTGKSLVELGIRFGGRDHTTVLNAVRKIGTRIAADPAFASEIETLMARINPALPHPDTDHPSEAVLA